MADIRIRDLPAGGGPVATDFVPIDNGTTRRATIQTIVETGRPVASQAEAEAGTEATKVMTPLTTSQAVNFYGLTKDGNLAGLVSQSASRTNLGVAIGSDVQAFDAGLASIASLTTAADQMLYTTASDVYATTALTSFARTLLDDTTSVVALNTLGIGNAINRIQTRSQIIRGDNVSDVLWASRIGDFDNGERGALFIWNNPSPADLVAGKNSGAQIWIGDNPTATPGASDPVGLTVAIINGNSRTTLYGMNILAANGDLGAGWNDGHITGLEINVGSGFSATVTDAFAGGNRKNGMEITGQSGPGGRLTAAQAIWVNNTDGSAWWNEGIAISRCVQYGIRFQSDPAGSVDTINAFSGAAIYDASKSVSVLRVSGTHTNLIDISDNPVLTNFTKGRTNANTSLLFTNGADFGFDITLNSGSASAQNSSITLADRGIGKWQLIKNNGNDFGIFNVATTLSSISINTSTDNVSTARNLFVGGGGNPFGLGRVVSINAPSGNTGVDLQIATVSKMAMVTDGSTFGQVLTTGAYDLLLGTNTAEKLRINNIPGNGLGLKMAVPANSYANDAAAAVAGIAVGEFYRNGSAIQQRVA